MLQLIHVDLGGPILKETLDLSKYFLVFTNDYSWKSWVCFLCAKSETIVKFKIFKELVKCEIGKKTRAIKQIVEENSHLQHSTTIVKLMGSKDN